MNIIRHILSLVLWVVLFLALLMPFVLESQSVQARLGGRLSSALSELLGAKVEVGRVGFSLPARLTADDVTVYDPSQDTLLNVKRLSAGVGLRDLADGKLTITSAQLFGADVRISQAEAGAPLNCQFIIDALSSDDSTSTGGIDLRVGSLIVRRSSVRFDRLYEPQREAGFDANHVAVSDISGQLRLRALTDDSLNLVVKKLSLREQSGIRIERLATKVVRGRESLRIDDFMLRMAESNLSMDSLVYTHPSDSATMASGMSATAAYAMPAGVRESLRCSPIVGRLVASDFAFLVPKLSGERFAATLTADIGGYGGEYNLKALRIESPDESLRVGLNGRMDSSQRWAVTLTELTATGAAFAAASHCLGDSATTAGRILSSLNAMTLGGEASGDGKGTTTFTAVMQADSIDLSRMSGTDDLKSCNLGLQAAGTLTEGRLTSAEGGGTIARLEYKGYRYADIDLRASYTPRALNMNIDLDDENAALSATAFYDPHTGTRSATLKAIVERLCPERLSLAENTADYCLENVELTLGSDGMERQYVDITSPYGTARLVGSFDPLSLPRDLTAMLSRHLPIEAPKMKRGEKLTGNYSVLVQTDNTEWLDRLFGVPLELHDFSEIYAKVDCPSETLIMSINSPAFCYDGRHCDSLAISMAHTPDSLHLHLATDIADDDGSHVKLQAACGAQQNTIAANLAWATAETPHSFSGTLSARAMIESDSEGKTTTRLNLLPSEMMVDSTAWHVEPSSLTYSEKQLRVDHFAIGNASQRLAVSGSASESSSDSLVATLKGIDVEYILNLVDFHSVAFGGRATGVARVKQLFGEPDARASLTVSDFTFQHGDMGTLYANARWNNERKSIDIDAQAVDTLMDYQPFGRSERLTGTGRIIIDGYISPANDDILLNMKAENGNIAFLQSFTKNFAKDVRGRVRGELQLVGPLSKVNLVGNARVDGDLFIKPLNCLYHLSDAPVSLVRDTIHLPGITVYDRHGSTATVGGNIFHRNLGRISYDFGIDAKRLLCYDFKDFGEQTFHGTVYASGPVHISGGSDDFTLSAELTPERGSSFTYNVSDQNSIASREFISWRDVTPRRLSPTALHQSSASHHQSSASHKPENRKAKYLDDDMRLSFVINANPNLAVRLLMNSATNDYITLYGNGTLTAEHYNKGAFTMFGTYTVERGTYEMTIQDILKKNFTFEDGSTLIFRGNPFLAQLDLKAVHTVNGVSLADLNIGNSYNKGTTRVNCLMNIGGEARQPQVTFDIDLPTASNDERQMLRSVLNSEDLMNQQVVYLLGIGRFYPQGTNNATAQSDRQQSETALAMQSLLSGTISGQLSTMLNSVINSNNWSFGANISTGNAGWDNAEYEGLLSGRLLDNRLIINGQFGYRDNASTDKSSFVGDFDVRYLLQPNGNIALKIYNQTNDKYFTKSSLTTQGLGLILKKDFTHFSELFGKRKREKGIENREKVEDKR